VYHVDQRVGVDQRVYWRISTPPKFPDVQQLYNKKGFERSCREWANRPINNRKLSDIYDGRIWKEFKDPCDDQLFFRHDVSDSHLGIMLNLDWFQPFDNSQYSVGVIYGVICNLPRSERFKAPNIITLVVILGPNEPKLHQLNHYLAPIVRDAIRMKISIRNLIRFHQIQSDNPLDWIQNSPIHPD